MHVHTQTSGHNHGLALGDDVLENGHTDMCTERHLKGIGLPVLCAIQEFKPHGMGRAQSEGTSAGPLWYRVRMKSGVT